MRRMLIALVTLLASAGVTSNAQAVEEPAQGTFTMTTAPGILPAWTSNEITIVGIAPGTVTTSRFSTDATIQLPVIARSLSANATAGGFRIVNTETNASVRCLIPSVDTKALVVDCLTSAGYNSALFSIEKIGTRQSFVSSTTRTTIFQDMDLYLTTAGAQILKSELKSSVFSTSVRVATGNLMVSRER